MRLAIAKQWIFLQELVWLVLALGLATLTIVDWHLTLILIVVFAVVATSIITPYASLAFVIVLAPLRTLVATEYAWPLPLDVGQLLLITFFATHLLHSIVKQKSVIEPDFPRILLVLLLFVSIAGLTVISAFDTMSWLLEWLKWLIILAIAYLVAVKYRNFKWLIWILLSAACANALVGIYIFFGGSGADHLLINDRFFRAFGTFGQPNPFGGFMGLILPISLMLCLQYVIAFYQKRSAKFLALIVFTAGVTLLLLGGLLTSWSRGAWLSFFVSVAVMIFVLPRKLKYSFFLSVTVGILSFLLWSAGFVPRSIVDRIASSAQDLFAFQDVRGVDITTENYAIVERLAHWQAALNMSTENPWLGVGVGNYEIAYSQYRLLNWQEPLGHAHNYYLNILAEGGIIAALAYMLMWGLIIGQTWRLTRHPSQTKRFISVGLLGAWTYLAVHSLFDNLYVNNLFFHIGVLIGILAILEQSTKELIMENES